MSGHLNQLGRAVVNTTVRSFQTTLPLAPRRPRPARFWLAFTLVTVATALGAVYWRERQLPQKIKAAAAAGQLDDCLRYGEQLDALSWLPGRAPVDQGLCRREKAIQHWSQGRWAEALRLQRQLVNSAAVGPSDQQRLQAWQAELERIAVERFRRGDLPGALSSLAPLGENHRADGNAVGDQLRLNWERNRLEWERASRLVGQSRWWEALDSLHRIDHPWWQQRAQPLSQRVDQQLARLRKQDQEHDGHGDLPHSVPLAQLDAGVKQRIAAGMNEWKAFESACRHLGGKVVDAGPETACER